MVTTIISCWRNQDSNDHAKSGKLADRGKSSKNWFRKENPPRYDGITNQAARAQKSHYDHR